jgi:hypothetical protein
MEEAPAGPGSAVVVRSVPPLRPPGQRFHYSNAGYKIVGYALEQVTGTPIHDLLEERVLRPLGMRHSQASITPESYVSTSVGYEPMFDDRPPHLNHPLGPAPRIASNTADGSIVSTVADMAAYARMLLAGGTAVVDEHEVALLSPAMFEELVAPRIATDDEGISYAYGLDVWTHEDGRQFMAHTGGMVGYTAHLILDLDSRLACVALQNGGGDKERLVKHAIEAVRASFAGMPVAEAPHPPAPTDLGEVDDLVGTYVGERTIELQRTSDGLRLVDGALGVLLERWRTYPPRTGRSFLVPHPSWDRHLLHVVRDDEGVVALTHGPETFVREGRAFRDDPAPLEGADALTGLYRSNDPWSPTLRIYARGGRLWMQVPGYGEESPLLDAADGWFESEDEDWVPARLRFQDVMDGRAMSVWFDGGRLYRSFEA